MDKSSASARRPHPLTDAEKKRLAKYEKNIQYSDRYSDKTYEYRHVTLPREMLKEIPPDYFDREAGTLKLLLEDEWRSLGILQSPGWRHYEIHQPEPHILLFKRPKNYQYNPHQ
ncbi:CKS-domain-containing protein [Ascobolus immersus RN42]|uniref:Cyclin-dependent kinases regulatory subunit n=1 Tax=Ascobolus immersus RN42 TaxID=1160509 RepID=A0A3N4IVD6_ASCIM|nr:CKS-domain-containing protein [Ascobolus immersus RN42]